MSDLFLLPATTYQPPARLARKHALNTIIEDKRGEREEERRERGAGNVDDRGRCRSLEPPKSHGSTSPVPSLTSSISSYYRTQKECSDYDDLYDVSDDDSDIAPSVMSDLRSSRSGSPTRSYADKSHKSKYPSLIIPSPSFWPTIEKANAASPPRPPKIPLSPANLSRLDHDLATSSNPPSLVNSLYSDPLAATSAPTTPDLQAHSSSGDVWDQGDAKPAGRKHLRPIIRICTDNGSVSNPTSGISPLDHVSVRDFASPAEQYRVDSPVLGSEDGRSESGVELPTEALQTLRHLSLDAPLNTDIVLDEESIGEMQEAPQALRRQSSTEWTPASAVSDYSISQISIPSPSGFFSSLGGNARHTWAPGSVPVSALPPSSTTAENFYSCPWNQVKSDPIEQIVEVDDDDTDGPPTARQVPLPQTASTVTAVRMSPRLGTDEAMELREEDYDQVLQETAEKSLDRTSTWLAAQTSYMSALRETNPVNDLSVEAETDLRRMSTHKKNDSLGSPLRKAVKFLESETAKEDYHDDKAHPETSIYYQAFQHIKSNSKRSDTFRHRYARAESAQSIRVCLLHEHISRLQCDFQLREVDRPLTHRPISMMPGKETDKPEPTSEQKVIARVGRERQALEQVDARAWVIEAMKFLNGGSLLTSPAKSFNNGEGSSTARILDLAGQPNGDWAWHCCREFPRSKIYTATTDKSLIDVCISGPKNHKRHAVSNLWSLPYPDNYFTAISARSLFAYLKTEKPLAESLDEYDLCLRECLRCLKPGGYLEFFTMDSEIINAGARATAVSVELAFNLKTRGYDPSPTRSFLGRLHSAGFDEIKRAWTVLPMGTSSVETRSLPETPPPNFSTFEVDKLEAVQGPVGSTADAASMTGLVGSWAWEQWMLRLETEMGKENLLEGVGAALEEGKGTGAGWRCLSGWARKPA